MGLLSETRQRTILEQLNQSGKVRVDKLAKLLDVTEVTIRRDLTNLHKNGFLKKIYGGAILAGAPKINPPVRYRQTRNLSAKRIIGQLAAELINEGDVIFLEAGSTCYEIIPYLADFKELTVIVNSLYLMSRLHELPRLKIIITGGAYRSDRRDMVGPTAEAAIAQLSGFKAFTGADDISLTAGISGADVVTVGFAKLVLRRSSQVIFVGDHTKFDNPALYKIADIDQLDCIVTNTCPSTHWLDAAKEKDIRIIYPGA